MGWWMSNMGHPKFIYWTYKFNLTQLPNGSLKWTSLLPNMKPKPSTKGGKSLIRPWGVQPSIKEFNLATQDLVKYKKSATNTFHLTSQLPYSFQSAFPWIKHELTKVSKVIDPPSLTHGFDHMRDNFKGYHLLKIYNFLKYKYP